MGKSNKYTEINYPALRTGDVVVCGGKGIIPYIIKWATVGFKKRHKRDVSSHTGVVIEVHGQKLVVEMLGTEGGIRLNSLEEYLKNKRRFIIDIKRFPNITEEDRTLIERQAAYDIRKGLEYDYKGCVEFLFTKLEDSKSKDYCSEYAYFLFKNCETEFFTAEEKRKFNKMVSPEDFNQLPNLMSLKWEI